MSEPEGAAVTGLRSEATKEGTAFKAPPEASGRESRMTMIVPNGSW